MNSVHLVVSDVGLLTYTHFMCDSFASVTQIVLAMFHLVFASSPKAK